MFFVIVNFTAGDGEHVGHFQVDEPSFRVSDDVLKSHVARHFGRPHLKVSKWRRGSENELKAAIAEIEKKYPKRETLTDLTGGQPTRVLEDPTIVDPNAEVV